MHATFSFALAVREVESESAIKEFERLCVFEGPDLYQDIFHQMSEFVHEFNFAAKSFIVIQAKELGLKCLEGSEVVEAVGVH